MRSMDGLLTTPFVTPTAPLRSRGCRSLPIALTAALLAGLVLAGPGAASVIVNVNPHKVLCSTNTTELPGIANDLANFDANAYHLAATCDFSSVLTFNLNGKPMIVSDDSDLGGNEILVKSYIDQLLDLQIANGHGRYHYEHFDHASDPKAKLGQTFASLSDFNAESQSVLNHIQSKKCSPTRTTKCVSALAPYGTLTRSGDQFLWNGQPVTLVGFSSMGALAGTNFDVEGYLGALASKSVNLTRVWAIEQWTALEVDAASQDVNNCETPFAGTFNGKWDLDQVNQRYMERAHRFVQAASERGIVVQLTLFDRHGLRNFTNDLGRWDGSPYNDANNEPQGFLPAAGNELAPTGFLSTSQTSGVGKVNHDLITRLVKELGGYGNVIFEVMNEPRPISGEWTAPNLLTWHRWVEDAAKATTTDTVIGEVGSVDVNHVQKTVSFQRTYTNPVVIAQPPTIAGGQAAIARIDSVTSSNFKLRIQEPSNLDGTHVVETVNYVVLEAGSWTLPDGTRLEVGKLNTGATVGPGMAKTWAQVSFANPLGTGPVVLSQVQSGSDASFVKTREVNVTGTGFQVAMEQEDSDTVPHGAETIGWVAMNPGQGTWSGHPYVAANTANAVTHNTNPWFTINFNLTEICTQTPGSRGLGPLPRFVASIATYDGGDGSTLRQQNLSANSVQIKVEEDTTVTPGVGHTTEVVSYLALGEDGLLTGAALSAPPDLPPTANFTFNCTDLSCSFNASGSTDDHGIISYSWNFGDGSSGSGVTPSHTYATGGTYNVTLTVTDTVGQTDTDTQSVTVSAPTTCGSTNPAPPPPAGALDFDGFTIKPYGGGAQQGNPTVCIEDNGFTLHLAGNGWRKIDLPYTITANTILEFDFRSANQGEVHGIGFDDNDDISDARMFEVYGTQSFGVTTFKDYAASAPNWKHYKIRVGDHFTGNTLYLTFANDHDVASPTGEGFFANVQVYEATVVNFNNYPVALDFYGSGQNPQGQLTVLKEDGGFTLHLIGNGWRKINLPVTITADTVLEFDFRSANQGEVHGIGFDDDLDIADGRMFQVYGTQSFGVTTFNNYATSAPNWKHYKIQVGNFFTGSTLYVTFANDHDVASPTAEGSFRNVTIY